VTDEGAPAGERAQLRWGPIWAGLLTALGLFVLLSLLAIAIGLQATPAGGEADADLGLVASIVTSAIALVSFFMGGFVASWSANLTHAGRSALNGFLVWALWLLLVLLLAALGAGQVFGIAADLFGPRGLTAPDVEAGDLVRTLRDGAWQTLLALGLTAAASALGGVIGAHDEVRRRWAYWS
jgi:hypothetical protein